MKTTTIVPGILQDSFVSIQTHVGLVKDFVSHVQLDICDGIFVQKATWPYAFKDTAIYSDIIEEGDGLPYWQDVNYELDLMVENAHKKFFTDWIKLGPSRVVFHFEAEDTASFVLFLQNLDLFYKETIQIGVAINITTDPKVLAPIINDISFVQCMGIEKIGVQGAPFDNRVIEHIQNIHTLYPDTKITVDGGVNFSSIKELQKLPISRYVVGSVLYTSFDLEGTINELRGLVEKNVVE